MVKTRTTSRSYRSQRSRVTSALARSIAILAIDKTFGKAPDCKPVLQTFLLARSALKHPTQTQRFLGSDPTTKFQKAVRISESGLVPRPLKNGALLLQTSEFLALSITRYG
jgi:hypothetical protein